MERKQREIVSVAWYTAMFGRQKRLASLNTILIPGRKVEGNEKAQLDADHDELVREMMR